MIYEYDAKIYGSIDSINKTILNILEEVSLFIDDEDICFDLRVVLSELLINCHEHGNKSDCQKSINLQLCIESNSIMINVKDEGEGFELNQNYNPHDCKSSGRGLMIVRSLVDSFQIHKNNIQCEMYI